MSETPRQLRATRNQALFREVNERVKDLQLRHGGGTAEWVCECADVRCVEPVPLSVDEYEHVRASPTRFLVAPGHVYPDVERIVFATDRYTVVEKADRVEPRLEHLPLEITADGVSPSDARTRS